MDLETKIYRSKNQIGGLLGFVNQECKDKKDWNVSKV
jgi:hypothetical protein